MTYTSSTGPHRLATMLQVLLFDQRGMGRSAKPPGPYTMLDFAADAAAIMDQAHWSSAHVVGYSFGGMVAQELAIGWPDRVQSLVLAATTPGCSGGVSYPIQDLLCLDPYERARFGLEIADLRFTPQWQSDHQLEAEARIKARMQRQTEYIDEPGTREGLVAQLQARAAHDAYDRLDRTLAPTLVLASDADGQAPLDAQRRMAARISGCELKTLPRSHNFIFESDAVYHEVQEHCVRNAG